LSTPNIVKVGAGEVAVSPVAGISGVGCGSTVGGAVLSTAGGEVLSTAGGVAIAAGAPQADKNIVNSITRETNLFISDFLLAYVGYP